MANAADTNMKNLNYYETVKHFPPIINGKVNFMEFLEAASSLVTLIERLSKIFTPVKYDMQGNIDKIKKFYEYDENSCLLELMLGQDSNKKPDIESVVWLNRALLFCELIFQEVLPCFQTNDLDLNTKKILMVAYEGSVKKYHNWVTQQLVSFVCKMAPTLLQMLKSVEADRDIKASESFLATYVIKLHLVRCKIDDFIKENNLFKD